MDTGEIVIWASIGISALLSLASIAQATK